MKNKDTISKFHARLFSWWEENRRDFPWRDTTDPYHIMVSEFMLQQTQASRVVPKYLEFIRIFPSMHDLGDASNEEVIRLWQGLGYNRRALWLRDAAKELSEQGDFPQQPEELIKLKGIGKYSSRSIPIFAFNADLATVDTNIRRILIHEGFATEETSEKELYQLAEDLLPEGRSRDYHNALMDYGAMEVTAKRTSIRSKGNQATFKGSDREVRGKILKILLDKKEMDQDLLLNTLGISEKRFEKIRDKMIGEDLIRVEDSKIML